MNLFFYKVCLFLIIAYIGDWIFFAEFEMKTFLMIVSFMLFSFLWAEEPQTPAQEQTNQAEATAEASSEKAAEAAPAEAKPEADAPAEAVASEETAEKPVAETAEKPAAEAEKPVAETAEKTAEEATEKPAAEEEPKAQEPANEPEVKEEDKTPSVNAEDEQGYNLKLRALEEKIDSLKDKIFKSKQRLAVLQETVLGGTVGGSTVTINHNNEVGNLYKLVSAVYYFDDKPVFKKVDLPEELEESRFQVSDAAVAPGPHRVSVYFVFIGKGYGVFSYLKEYSIKVTAEQAFTLEEGDIVEIEATAFDKGGMYSFENRIGVSFSIDKNTFENRDSAQEE